MMVGALVLPEVTLGKIEASITRSPPSPWALSAGSTTFARASGPMRQVPTGWEAVPAGLGPAEDAGDHIGRQERALARHRLGVADGAEIELDIGPRQLGSGADEAAGLVDADRERPAPRREVLQGDAQAPPPRAENGVE